MSGKSPVDVTTAPQQWAYAASIPIVLDRKPGSKRLIHLSARVLKGEVGLGILNRKSNIFEVEKNVYPAPKLVDIYIPIPAPDQADDLIIRNTSAAGAPSEISLGEAEILAPARLIEPYAKLAEIASANPQASIERAPVLSITTAPELWSYAAALPLHIPAGASGIVLKIRARVLAGEIGFGLLSADEKSLLVEQRYAKSGDSIDVVLPAPPGGRTGKLIIRNTAPGGARSSVIVEKIETWKLE
jgi:hypothetical protein